MLQKIVVLPVLFSLDIIAKDLLKSPDNICTSEQKIIMKEGVTQITILNTLISQIIKGITALYKWLTAYLLRSRNS